MQPLYCVPCFIRGFDDVDAYAVIDGRSVCFPCLMQITEPMRLKMANSKLPAGQQ